MGLLPEESASKAVAEGRASRCCTLRTCVMCCNQETVRLQTKISRGSTPSADYFLQGEWWTQMQHRPVVFDDQRVGKSNRAPKKEGSTYTSLPSPAKGVSEQAMLQRRPHGTFHKPTYCVDQERNQSAFPLRPGKYFELAGAETPLKRAAATARLRKGGSRLCANDSRCSYQKAIKAKAWILRSRHDLASSTAWTTQL